MIKSNPFLFLIPLLLSVELWGNTRWGKIEGKVYSSSGHQTIPYVSIAVLNGKEGTISDTSGSYSLPTRTGFYRLQASAVGYETFISEEVEVIPGKTITLDLEISEKTEILKQLVVMPSVFRPNPVSPISVRTLGVQQLEKSPGGNRDISVVLQNLPGVGSSLSFRNDLLVRGGGPSENRFFLDGIEIPVLNHFSTQGASGGPVGMINIDLVREIDFFTGAFPAHRGNTLSSLMDISLRNGNLERWRFRASVGASDAGLSGDGPTGKKSSLNVSVRYSYLQFLFSALELPFLPRYVDYQIKWKYNPTPNQELYLVSVGADDRFSLNKEANKTEAQRYTLDFIPINNQWNYTIGMGYKVYTTSGHWLGVLSRSMLQNRIFKYRNNIEEDSLLNLDYRSTEAINKGRIEYTSIQGSNRWVASAEVGFSRYNNKTFEKRESGQIDYNSTMEIYTYGLSVQRVQQWGRLKISAGIRADGTSYEENMQKMWRQFSPRLSLSYQLTSQWTMNLSGGRYFQLPPYTALGFRNEQRELLNQKKVDYIRSDQIGWGVEWRHSSTGELSFELFWKDYDRYPISLSDSISLANKGGDFGVVGNELVQSSGIGRAYGMEILYRNTNWRNIDFSISYTLFKSEAAAFNKNYVATAWDNRHLLNIVASRKIRGNWYVGFKWRFVGETPYTPYDMERSSLKSVWNVRQTAALDYTRFNTRLLAPFHQLDIRVDKEWNFKRLKATAYIDIQNVYGKASDTRDIITVRSPDGAIMEDPNDPSRYLLRSFPNEGRGSILPTIGVILNF